MKSIYLIEIFVGLFTKLNNQFYENEENLPYVHFYLYVNNTEFTDSMRKILTVKFNKIFNESFTNQEIKNVFEMDDFDTIFIVKDEDHQRKLLQCTVKLSKKLAYCPESLIEQIILAPEKMLEEVEGTKKTEISNEKSEYLNLKSRKISSPSKSKKELVHKPPKSVNELEQDEDILEVNVSLPIMKIL